MSDTQAIIEDNRKVIKGFLAKHYLDYMYSVSGCETCGPEYEWNCFCGASGDGAGSFEDHMNDMADKWVGDFGAEITKEGDVEW